MKIYKVTFRQYTNGLKDTIYSEKLDTYIHIDNKDFCLIRECDIEKAQLFGNGINELKLVGTLLNLKEQSK